jgi:DNA-directed RNA polymerase alpha subunit
MLLNVNVLQLQGTGEDEYAWEIAAVCASYEDAVDKLAEINAEYTEADDFVFTLNENARIETHDVVDNYWGL